MDNKTQIRNKDVENPFSEMGFIKFWIVSTAFWFSFPVSLVLCYLAMGQEKTKQLVRALVHDFLQTLFLIFVVVCVILYAVYYFVSNLLTIVLMLVIKNFVISEEKIFAQIEENKKKPKKAGGFTARLQKAMEEAEKQQKAKQKGKR